MRLLCLATGNFWNSKFEKDSIGAAKKLCLDGIELTYGKMLDERPIPEKHFPWLRKQKSVTIHAPFRMVRNPQSKEQLLKDFKKIESDYKKSGARYLVTHPKEMPPDEILSKLKMNFLIENMEKRKNKSRLGFERVLKKYPKIGLCLDVSHAYTWSPKETERIIKRWKPKIKQIHFSSCYHRKTHSMFNRASNRFLKSIWPIKELNVPIVVEDTMGVQSMGEIKEEIKKIKQILLNVYG